MPNNFFITGTSETEKTTLLRDLAKELLRRGVKVGGFISPDELEHGTREGYYVQDIESRKTGTLATVGGNGAKVGKYNVDVKSFESIALKSMKNATKYEVLIIDEIGNMEMKSIAFQDTLADLMVSRVLIIAAISESYVNTYEIFGRVYNLEETDRGEVFSSILRNMDKILGTRKVAVKKVDIKKIELSKVTSQKAKPIKVTKSNVQTKKKTKQTTSRQQAKLLQNKKKESKGFLGKLRNALGF
ncbi:MAG: nucleoside-triphosphatase [Candidatus Micrarchaeota archaeon]|nr:nucleoside-triphosphatase [Candidatus Micrarchaeota archaeon]